MSTTVSSSTSSILENYIASQSSSTSSTTTTSSSDSTSLWGDFTTFLKILTTQLENQDPMDATDTDQFTQELVEFAGVEQQISTNDKLDTIISTLDGNGITPLLSYVGKTVEVSDDDQIVLQDGSATFSYTLASAASDVTITVKDADGSTVATMSGLTASGVNRVSWDGTTDDGDTAEDGVYTVEIEATNSSDKSITVSNIDLIGAVTSIQTDSDGTTTLSLGDAYQVSADDVVAVYSGISTESSSS